MPDQQKYIKMINSLAIRLLLLLVILLNCLQWEIILCLSLLLAKARNKVLLRKIVLFSPFSNPFFKVVIKLQSVKRQLDDANNQSFKNVLANISNGVCLEEDFQFLTTAFQKHLPSEPTLTIATTNKTVLETNLSQLNKYPEN